MVCTVLMLAGCGGSATTVHRSRSSGSLATSGAARGPGVSAASTAHDQSSPASGSVGVTVSPSPVQVQKADAINLQAGEVPAGWTSVGTSTSLGAAQTTSLVSSCPGVAKPELTGFVSSPVFTDGASATAPTAALSGVEIGSLVGFASSPSVARQVVAFIGSPAGATCVRAEIERAFAAVGSGSAVHLGDVSITSTAQQLDGAPGAVLSIGFSVHLASVGIDESVDETVDVFAEGETLVEMWTVNLPTSDQHLAAQLLAGLVRRA